MTASLYKQQRQAKIRRKRTFRIIKLLLVMFLAWFIGLIWFVGFKLEQTTLDTYGKSDGIVVLTGGVGRIDAGIAAFDIGLGKRMLISGVNANLAAPTIFNAYGVSPNNCDDVEIAEQNTQMKCITLGRQALDTKGNAVEAKQWAEKNGFKSLMLITSEYHMRRALMELEQEAPELEITPFVVETKLKWSSIALEYTKYLYSLAKHTVFS